MTLEGVQGTWQKLLALPFLPVLQPEEAVQEPFCHGRGAMLQVQTELPSCEQELLSALGHCWELEYLVAYLFFLNIPRRCCCWWLGVLTLVLLLPRAAKSSAGFLCHLLTVTAL